MFRCLPFPFTIGCRFFGEVIKGRQWYKRNIILSHRIQLILWRENLLHFSKIGEAGKIYSKMYALKLIQKKRKKEKWYDSPVQSIGFVNHDK